MNERSVRDMVRKKYGELALAGDSCCGTGSPCCGEQRDGEVLGAGYHSAELGSVPEGAPAIAGVSVAQAEYFYEPQGDAMPERGTS